jgi:hypothetical protein
MKHTTQQYIQHKPNQETPHHTQTKRQRRSTTSRDKMGHLHIRWKRNEEDYKTVQRSTNTNSIQNAKQNKEHNKTILANKYEKSDIYQMKCLDCPLQTGRTFHTRYKEHNRQWEVVLTVTQDIQIIYWTQDIHIALYRHNECYKNREKREMYEHIKNNIYICIYIKLIKDRVHMDDAYIATYN